MFISLKQHFPGKKQQPCCRQRKRAPDQGSRPASGDLWCWRFSPHTGEPPGLRTNGSTVVTSSRELWAAIGDQHLTPGQIPYHTVLSFIQLYGCLQGKGKKKRHVFLLILSLSRKSAESLSTNQEKNNAEPANTLISFTLLCFLTARRLIGNVFDSEITRA